MRLLPLLLIALSLGLYSNTLTHGFVWDDHYFIDENSKLDEPGFLRSALTRDLWQNTDINMKSGFYRPLVLTATYAAYAVAGTSAWAYHLLSVLLHGANGALLFHFLLKLTGKRLAAFFAALLFIVHPLASETVNLIANWGDLLCTLFMLLCLVHYTTFLEKRRNRNFIASLIFLLMAFLSKENAMAGVALIAMAHFCYAGRPRGAVTLKETAALLPFLVLTLCYIAFRAMIVGPQNAVTNLENVRYVSVLPSFDLISHILTTAKIVALYLQMFFYPAHQSISHIVLPSASALEPVTLVALFALVSLMLLTLVSFLTDKKWIGFGLGWFFIMILPVSNLIPISNTIAERFMYLPMIGLCFLTAHVCAQPFIAQSQRAQRVSLALVILLAAILGIRTFNRNTVWASDYALFSQTTDKIGCAPIAHINLVAYYNRQQQWDKAAWEQHMFLLCKSAIKEEYQRLKLLRQGG